MSKLHEQAYELAAKGLTNVEIFGSLQISAPQLLKLTISDQPLLYSVIRGRVDYLAPYLDVLQDESLERKAGPGYHNTKALLSLIERMDKETRALGIGYDLAVLASAPAASEERVAAAEVTRRLREGAL